MLGEIVINDQGVFAAVTEVLAHGAAGERGQELHGSRIGSGGRHDHGVFHGAVLFQLAHHVGDGGLLLTDGHVDTLNAGVFLVNDGVHRHGGLTDLAVADDQLTLATADRGHGVDGFETGLYRLVHLFTPDHAGRHFLDGVGFGGVHRTFAVHRVTQGVDHAAEQFRAHRHFQNAAGAADLLALRQTQVITQHHGAHGVLLQVEGHAEDAALKLDHFAEHHVGQTMNAHDAVKYGYHRTFVPCLGGGIKFRDARLDNLADFGRVELLHL